MILWAGGSQVGSQNQSKINQKMKSNLDCLLASIFWSTLMDFEAKLGLERRGEERRGEIGKVR